MLVSACVCVAGSVISALSSGVLVQHWCYAIADLAFFFIAVRYVYVTWRVNKAIRPEARAANPTLRRAVFGFVGTPR